MKRYVPNDTELAMFLNNNTLHDYFTRLELISRSIFSWEGIDDIGGNQRFLEKKLFDKGKAVFFKDNLFGYKTLECLDSDKKNVYYEPTKVRAIGNNYNKEIDIDDCVIIHNNNLDTATRFFIFNFAVRLTEIQRTMDVNLNAQQTPIVIEGDTKSITSLKNAYMKISGHEPVLFGRKNFNIQDKLNVLNTEAPFLLDKLTIYKHDILNECLTFLGINNANTDKKERLITNEVDSNDELIKFYLNCFYEPRKRACDEINEKFFNGEEKIKVSVNIEKVQELFKDLFNEEDENEETNEYIESSDNNG